MFKNLSNLKQHGKTAKKRESIWNNNSQHIDYDYSLKFKEK